MITTFTVVRHGETAANQGNIIQGQTDVPLSEAGENQAKLLGRRWKNKKFDAVYSSDLSRARRTAELALPSQPATPSPLVRTHHCRDRRTLPRRVESLPLREFRVQDRGRRNAPRTLRPGGKVLHRSRGEAPGQKRSRRHPRRAAAGVLPARDGGRKGQIRSAALDRKHRDQRGEIR